MKIYLGKDNRRRVWKKYPDGTKKIITYARHLMEEKIGRRLNANETVDHIDRNKLHDIVENLQILSKNEHVKIDSKHVKKVIIICVWCGIKKERTARYVNHNAKLGKAGPFCGRSHAGKYGASVQNGGIKLPVQLRIPKEIREYFYLEK